MKKLISGFLILMSFTGYSQQTESTLSKKELKKLKHIDSPEKVEALFDSVESKFQEFLDFTTVEASIKSTADLSKMHKHIKEFKYDYDIETVWNAMGSVTPKEMFAGPKVHFGRLYSEVDQKTYYRDDSFVPKVQAGMTIINYLTLAGGLIRMSVAVKIVVIDKENKTLELAYAQGNTSTGTQVLTLREEDGKTVINHTSYFKSDSRFRDVTVYKPFHSVTIGEYHDTLKEILKLENPISK
jgi:hypothetical protein